MSKYLSKVLRARFAHNTALAKQGSNSRKKNIIDLALQSYVKDYKIKDTGKEDVELDPEFEKFAIDQMNAFIFAGESTTVCDRLCVVNQQRVKAEKDAILTRWGAPESRYQCAICDPKRVPSMHELLDGFKNASQKLFDTHSALI